MKRLGKLPLTPGERRKRYHAKHGDRIRAYERKVYQINKAKFFSNKQCEKCRSKDDLRVWWNKKSDGDSGYTNFYRCKPAYWEQHRNDIVVLCKPCWKVRFIGLRIKPDTGINDAFRQRLTYWKRKLARQAGVNPKLIPKELAVVFMLTSTHDIATTWKKGALSDTKGAKQRDDNYRRWEQDQQ